MILVLGTTPFFTYRSGYFLVVVNINLLEHVVEVAVGN